MSDLSTDLKREGNGYLLQHLFLRRNRLHGLRGQLQAIQSQIAELESERAALEAALKEKHMGGANLTYSGLLVRVPGKNEVCRDISYETFSQVT